MTWLPTGTNYIYPDGKRRQRPSDGQRFVHEGETYTWDDLVGEWSDWRGQIQKFTEKDEYASMYGYGQEKNLSGFNDSLENKKETKTEGDKLKDFFFPKNSRGCQCGVWLTGSDKHSKGCWLYRED